MDNLLWWQKAVFYQIYPRSFADSNGDGIGDLLGIVQKLDYLQDLGIDAIWLSPHYPSPQVDCGYDISDYEEVAPEYGTLSDFKRLVEALHRRGMHLILDLVLNHTSDQHGWFLESGSNRENEKRDWYIWRDGRPGAPPNNWYSTFGGSAWEFDPATSQYYYHFFFKQQPDLNWRNPAVHKAMFEVMRFWMDLGVDGFRLDAIGTIFEDPNLTDQEAPVDQTELYRMSRTAITPTEHASAVDIFQLMFRHQIDLPEIHTVLRELRNVTDAYPLRVLVGETDMVEYYGNGRDELHMAFNFPLMRTERLSPAWVRENQATRLAELPPTGWPCNTLGNHDSSRLISHFGDGLHNTEIARIGLVLMLTLRGTPFLYNGEEIGMTDLLLEDIHQFRDKLGVWAYETEIGQLNSSADAALAYAARQTRDKCRTPMQWANQANGGFCPPNVSPWLPVNLNYAEGVNVAEQETDPASLLNFYKRLLRVRKSTPALIDGDFEAIDGDAPGYLGFMRHSPSTGQTCLVVINMTGDNQHTDLNITLRPLRLLYSNRPREEMQADPAHLDLAPYEILIGELK